MGRLAPLSAKEHAAHRKKLECVRYIKTKYLDEAEINIIDILKK